MRRKPLFVASFVALAMAFLAVASPALALPPKPLGTCAQCRILNFGPMGTMSICALVSTSGYETCYVNPDELCYAFNRCWLLPV